MTASFCSVQHLGHAGYIHVVPALDVVALQKCSCNMLAHHVLHCCCQSSLRQVHTEMSVCWEIGQHAALCLIYAEIGRLSTESSAATPDIDCFAAQVPTGCLPWICTRGSALATLISQ